MKPKLSKILSIFIILFTLILLPAKVLWANHIDIIKILTFDDLITLSKTKYVTGNTNSRLNLVLYNPIVDNSFSKTKTGQKFNNDKNIGDFVRVASWNIERGLNIDSIKMLFSSPDELMKKFDNKKNKNIDKKTVENQIDILKKADIITLCEVDIGMPRTKYKNVAEDLAKTLGYNYAFGTEFVEVDPSHLGLEENKWSEENILFPNEKYVVDKSKYKGLQGNAILSRFPIKNARIIRLPNYYDWFNNEIKKITEVEYIRREASQRLFREDVIREIRRGSRIALVADIELPGYEKPLTVIAAHIENRTIPQNRYEQMKVLLDEIKKIDNPLVIAGDFNTTVADASPTSIKREVRKKISDPQFLVKQTILFLIPLRLEISLANYATTFLRTYKNPTVVNIPVIFPNKERKLFSTVEKFQFNDGAKFDFSGNKYQSANKKGGRLANSNQRDLKGFTPTFIFQRPLVLGKYKLDWILVKPELSESKTKEFEPFYGRTLKEMNYAFGGTISDHSPVTVDLAINPPSLKELKNNYKQHKKSVKKNKKD